MPQQSRTPQFVSPTDSPTPDAHLQSAPPTSLSNIHDEPPPPPQQQQPQPESSYPIYYFLYGTLKTPYTLSRILDLPSTSAPVLHKAHITGYALAKWGDYPALIPGESEQEVKGCAYLVPGETEAGKLARYETSAYRVEGCLVVFEDGAGDRVGGGKTVWGRTFVYAGDPQALLEQKFDRKLWALQIGGKLG